MHNERWLLPEGIDELLPEQARALEHLRRRLLDHYGSWGYQLVITPFIEYLESLLTGTGKDLDLQTFKLTDQLSGRQLGVRADITPQVARIDAHHLRRDEPTRLCYIGTVLRTRSDGFAASRSPLQIGAELYGHAGLESDLEILSLMLETLSTAGVRDIYLDLGHVGIYRGLARQAGLDADQEAALFEVLQRKAQPEIDALIREFGVTDDHASMLSALASLNGDDDVIPKARLALAKADDDVLAAIDYVAALGAALAQTLPGVPLHYDLAELRAYHYQTGAVFAAFVPGLGTEVARGGRYDHIGEVFGRARAATGFSTDLKTLMRVANLAPLEKVETIFAPWADNAPGLLTRINELRHAGKVVVRELPGQVGDAVTMGCTHRLQQVDGEWVVSSL